MALHLPSAGLARHLTDAQRAAVIAACQPLAADLTLYHGSGDGTFYSKIAYKQHFHPLESFQMHYCNRTQGATTQYGPGIYAADTYAHASGYAAGTGYVIRFECQAGITPYLDIHGAAYGAHGFGVARQNVLNDAFIPAVIRVTANYYVLRTPVGIHVELA